MELPGQPCCSFGSFSRPTLLVTPDPVAGPFQETNGKDTVAMVASYRLAFAKEQRSEEA